MVVAIVAGGLAPASPARSAFLGRNGLLAFSTRAGDIFTVKPDGSSLRRLGRGADPAWSPDGKKIAFVSGSSGNADIYVINANGTGVTQITRHASTDIDPAWSPDGTRLAFSSNRNNGFHIFTIRATAPYGVPQQLTTRKYKREYEKEPAWSPDGSVIMYSAKYLSNFGNTLDLETVDAKSGLVSRVNFAPDTYELSPNYAPRGRKIAYIASEDYWYYVLPTNVFKANPDGTQAVNLTNNLDDFGGPYYEYPTWSPDGNSLIVYRTANDGTPPGLYIMRADGTGLRWLADGYRADWQPIPL